MLAGWTDDESDWRHEVLAENLELLRNSTDAKGRKFEVHTIPMPQPMPYSAEEVAGVDAVEGTIPREAGDEAPASYINFYLCNGGLILPSSTILTTPRRSNRFSACSRTERW